MGDKTGIEWTDATWNPTTGCDKVSPGCDNCYAMTLAKRLKAMGSSRYQLDGDPQTSGPGFGVSTHSSALDQPLRWTRPRRIFVNSMSDLFHAKVPDEFIARVFAVMALTPRHTYQVLTKRHARMKSLLSSEEFVSMVDRESIAYDRSPLGHRPISWPLPNVWLGVSAEDQKRADLRIPALLDTPAAVRFVSAEPLLGPIDLIGEMCGECLRDREAPQCATCMDRWWIRPGRPNRIDWVIVGGESGPRARPMLADWVRSLRDQSIHAGIAFHFKQWGEWISICRGEYREPDAFLDELTGEFTRVAEPDGRHLWNGIYRVGKKNAGRELDGRTWDQYPETTRTQICTPT